MHWDIAMKKEWGQPERGSLSHMKSLASDSRTLREGEGTHLQVTFGAGILSSPAAASVCSSFLPVPPLFSYRIFSPSYISLFLPPMEPPRRATRLLEGTAACAKFQRLADQTPGPWEPQLFLLAPWPLAFHWGRQHIIVTTERHLSLLSADCVCQALGLPLRCVISTQ